MKGKYIAVEGPPGTGKTTLVKTLSEYTGSHAVLDDDSSNTFLKDLHVDSAGTAFRTQMFFLQSRLRQQEEIFRKTEQGHTVLCDYYFPDREEIFPNTILSVEELHVYSRIREIIDFRIPEPDAKIVLQADINTIMKRIENRGCDFDEGISTAFIQSIVEEYRRIYHDSYSKNVLLIDSREADFTDLKSEAFRSITNLIQDVST